MAAAPPLLPVKTPQSLSASHTQMIPPDNKAGGKWMLGRDGGTEGGGGHGWKGGLTGMRSDR